MLDFHVAHGHEGTVMVVQVISENTLIKKNRNVFMFCLFVWGQVTDPTKYGVVVFESDEKSMVSLVGEL